MEYRSFIRHKLLLIFTISFGVLLASINPAFARNGHSSFSPFGIFSGVIKPKSVWDLEIPKPDPKITLTDTGDSNSAILSRTDTNASFTIKNTVGQIGAIGNALDFGGTDERVTTPIVSETDGLSAITIVTWMRPTIADAFYFAVSKDVALGIGLVATNTYRWSLMTTVGGTAPGQSAGTVNLNTWQMMVIRFDGTDCELLKNGSAVVDTIAGSGVTVTEADALYVGNFRQNGSDFFHFIGKVDETVIWGKALSDNDLDDLYNSGNGLVVNVTDNFPTDGGSMGTNIITIWHFDESSGTNVSDSSGNGHHGTTQNMEDGDWAVGKIASATADVEATGFEMRDGVSSGEKGRALFGDPSSGTEMQGITAKIFTNSLERMRVTNGGLFALNITNPEAMLHLVTNTTTEEGLIIQGSASQTANLLEWWDSAGNIQGFIDANGAAVFNEEGNDVDFRVEGGTEDNLFRVDAGTDTVRFGDWDTNYFTTDKTGDSWWVGSSGLPFGEAHQTDGATFAVSITTQDVWVEVDAATTSINATELNLITFPDDHYLLCTKAGKYLVTYSFSGEINSVAGGDQHIESGVMVNGAIQTDKGTGHEQYAATGKERNLQGHTIIDVPTNGQISIALKNTVSAGKVLTLDHFNLTVTQVGGT